MARQQAHVENFLYLKLVWVLFTKRFRKIRVESKWSTTFLVTVVSAEDFLEQRNIKKKKIRPTLFTNIGLRPVSNVVLLQCRTKLIELNSTLARQTSATFETKSCYCRVAGQALLCYTAVARLGFKRCATAVPNSIHKL